MILISNDFWNKIKMYNCDPYNVLLAISTNIAVLLMTASVLQGHKLTLKTFRIFFQKYLIFYVSNQKSK